MGSLFQRISCQLDGLSGLLRQLKGINDYLELVVLGKLPVNHSVIYQLQNIFNLLPDLKLNDTVRSLHVNTNDQMLVIYVASIVRSILALHDLINNKLTNRETERSEEFSSMDQKKVNPVGDQSKRGQNPVASSDTKTTGNQNNLGNSKSTDSEANKKTKKF